jgi:DNA/RNA endonuclease G (NUC1)
MADIFLSYAHADRERVRKFVKLFEEEGWSVWWDRGISPGMEWLPELERELTNSRIIVVIWSNNSVVSTWVDKEVNVGLARNSLVPIVIDEGAIPGKYLKNQACDLSNWNGTKQITEIETLLRAVAKLVPPSRIDTVRPGFDTKFLGDDFEIPLPGVYGSAAVLRYNHFTVVMNPARRLAHYSAYNVDGHQFQDLARPDEWAADPILPESLQINRQLLTRSGYDRGHLMAQKTIMWGDEISASISSKQAFYWTNIAPQLAWVNRKSWLRLEQLERKIAETYGKTIGFSGPLFSTDDEKFGGEQLLQDGLIAYDTFQVPQAYWKVILCIENGKLKTAAFCVNQNERPDKKVKPNETPNDYRISIKHLEEMAKLRFINKVKKAAALTI